MFHYKSSRLQDHDKNMIPEPATLSFRKFGGVHIVPSESVGAGIGHGEVHLRRLSRAKVPIGAGVLHFVERVPEHLVVGLLPVEKKIDGCPYLLVIDLAVQEIGRAHV